jgi:MEDS: MEthanogen/methylotroph, DcmR Sensory domain
MTQQATNYHAIQFYPDGESLSRTVADFLICGLLSGEPAIVIATPSHTSLIRRQLTERGFDADQLRRTGELQLFDAKKMLSAFMVNNMPDPLLFRSNAGDVIDRLCVGRKPCPIRAYGEMVDVLWQEGNSKGALRLENLWNQLASTYDFKLLCGYAAGHFNEETRSAQYRAVCEQHSHIIPPH